MIRLAVYFLPAPHTPLAKAGAQWLGRDLFARQHPKQMAVQGISKQRLQELTRTPRHYGWHATIKPPFRLRPEIETHDVAISLHNFAGNRSSFILPPLKLTILDNFFCLTLSKPCPQLAQLAEDAVRQLHHFAAMPDETELARRRREGLTPRQEIMLTTWNYPYVLEEFRFHLTLTERLRDGGEIERLHQELSDRFPPSLLTNAPCNGLYLCLEYAEKPFQIAEFAPFGSSNDPDT